MHSRASAQAWVTSTDHAQGNRFGGQARGPRPRLAVRASAIAALAATLAACSTGASDTSATGSQQPLVSTAGIAKGQVDSITWNLTSGEPDTLDPPNAATYGGGQVVTNLCDTLVRYDADYHLSAGLATYDQVSPTKLVYNLRADATFWDGQPVTAQDVVYDLQRAENNTIVSTFFASVSSIEATGPKQVTVNFSSPDEKFNNEMTNIAGAVYEQAYAQRAGKNFGTAAGGVMCSGPFKLDKWNSGDSITMSRNDNYWDKTREPFAKNVKFTFITDATNLTQALESGSIDGAYQIPAGVIPALSKSAAGHLYFGPSTEGVTLNVANPGGVTADATFMGGLQHIIDRNALVKAIYYGAAQPLYTVLTPRTWPTDQTAAYQQAYDTYVSARAYDLDAAKQQISKSSYRGQTLTLAYATGDPTTDQITQLVQQQAAAAGVQIKLEGLGSLDYQQAGYDASKRKGIDLMLGSNFNSTADPLEPALFDFMAGSPYNYTGLQLPGLTSLLNQAVATFDPAKRAGLIIEAQKIWEAAETGVPLVSTDTVTFLNKRLTGAVTSFAYWSMPSLAFIGAAS